MTLFYSFLKNYSTSATNTLTLTLSTIIIFKQCKFNVSLWPLCFMLQKVPKSFKVPCSSQGHKCPTNWAKIQTHLIGKVIKQLPKLKEGKNLLPLNSKGYH